MMENMALILYYVSGLFKQMAWMARIVLELVLVSCNDHRIVVAVRDVMDVNEGLVLTLGLLVFEVLWTRHLPHLKSSSTVWGGRGP